MQNNELDSTLKDYQVRDTFIENSVSKNLVDNWPVFPWSKSISKNKTTNEPWNSYENLLENFKSNLNIDLKKSQLTTNVSNWFAKEEIM